MAKINMTLKGVLHYEGPDKSKKTTSDITLATEQTSCDIYSQIKDADSTILKFSLALKEFSFHKKMYQPTEVLALVNITKALGENYSYQRIDWTMLDKMFKHAKVSLTDGDFTIGNDYYVHEVLPHYQKDCMNVILKIYSVDKIMTVREASRTFVGKKLFADILDKERLKYTRPWVLAGVSDGADETQDKQTNTTSAATIGDALKNLLKQVEKDDHKHITVETNNMKILRYGDKKTEHIFPYLVQYNESFYDMLARTANRWGEFMFYEDNQLNIGYSATTPVAVDESEIKDIAVFDAATKQLSIGTDGDYDYSANNGGLVGKPVEKSPYIVKAQMGAFGGMVDKWIINQLTAVFKNDKNLPTLIGNLLFDNLFNLAKEESKVACQNSDFNKKYEFDKKPAYADQYGTFNFAKKDEDPKNKDAFQQFTEMPIYDSEKKKTRYIYDDSKYKYIVEKELTVGQKAIHIDYDTTHPKLKLGSIISFNGMNFIVVEILGVKSETSNMTFQVVATAQDTVDKIFYPSVIPAGHIRYAHPQPATITDADDPIPNKNRARVMFAWQEKLLKKDKDDKMEKSTKELSSPWLNFASNQQGQPILGKHYEGNPVMVGFEEGNVERPYIMGGLGDVNGKPNKDLVFSSPGEHMLTLTDGTGSGMQAFLAGAFSPLFNNFMSFVPTLIPPFNWDKNKYFEGGFELTDRYGMYKITGSTDSRNVSIASNWGDVKINAFTGITISAPNGDVSITGKNVSIKAGNNLTLESGTNVNYKLWKSKDTKAGSAAQMLLEITAQVTKKLAATIMDVIDLSVIRSVVEIFFRPVEGSLTLKSNRFLKLEAGESRCAMPENAFNVKERQKMLDEINKEAIVKGAGIGNGMVEVIKIIPPLARHQMELFIEKYNTCVDDLLQLKNWIKYLRTYANDKSTAEKPVEVCKSIDDLLKDLWDQKDNNDWKEDKYGFTDQVKVEGEPNKIVPSLAVFRISEKVRNHISYVKKLLFQLKLREMPKAAEDYQKIYSEACKRIIEDRKDLRKRVMDAHNVLRRHVYEMMHLNPTKEEINKLVGHFNMTVMPKDFKDKILKAFDHEKLKNVSYYTQVAESQKKLQSKIEGELTDNNVFLITLRRLVLINLLEEFGFKDDTRIPLNDQNLPHPEGKVPKTPTIDNVVGGDAWEAYVKSLSGVPSIEKDKWSTIGGALKGAFDEAKADQWKKIAFWKDLAEKKTWGEGKNGTILFASGDKTYNMNGDKFVAVTPLTSNIKYLSNASATLDSKEKETLQGFIEKIQDVLLKY